MVAQLNHAIFTHALHSPRPDPSDSPDVLAALASARALEEQGQIQEATRWLRRATEGAEKQSNDERVLVLARAAADLANTLGPAPLAVATALPPAPTASMPPLLAALVASVPLSSPPPPPVTVARSSAPATPADKHPTEQALRVGAIRVAIAGSLEDASSFVVQRLKTGQPTPAGTVEAMLVLTGEIEGHIELETTLRVANCLLTKP